MGTFKNSFSWSASRDRLFRSCKRAYFYNYYGYWDGWSRSASPRVKHIYRLKKIQSLPLWAGSIVHDVIKDVLERYQVYHTPVTGEDLKQAARLKLRTGWQDSVKQLWKNSAKKVNLFELYYGNGKTLPKEQTDAVADKVYSALDALITSDVLAKIVATPTHQWKPVDALGSYMLDDIKIWCAIDFAYSDDQGNLQIIDWKTGKENTEELYLQLAGYALYSHKEWNIPIENIRICGVYLNQGAEVKSYPVDGDMIVKAQEYCVDSVRDMLALLDDIDNNSASEENFATEPSDWKCKHCNYKEICPENNETSDLELTSS